MTKKIKRLLDKDEISEEDVKKMLFSELQAGRLAACFSGEDKETTWIESRRIRVKCNHCDKIVDWEYELPYDKDDKMRGTIEK